MGKPKSRTANGKKAMKMGKNKKKTWKQIEHEDVDKFLDEQREDERFGFMSTKSNDQLFAIDTDGASATQTWTRKKIPVEKSQDGPLIDVDDLKCFTLLKPHTQVPDPIIKRNRVKLPGEGKSALMDLKDARRHAKKILPKVPAAPPEIMDPWSMVEPKGILDSEWIPDSVRRHNLRPRIAPPAHKYKTSELPAIPAPHPGYSYNPTFDDHQDLLKLAVKKELVKQRKERNLIKATAPLHLATSGIKEEEDEEEEADEGAQPEDEKKSDTPKARTKQNKRKEREEKEKVREQKSKKDESVRMNEVFRIKTIQKEIKAAEAKQKKRLAILVEKKVRRERFGQKKLSKFKYEEPALNPALSDDLQGTLVGVSSDNSLLLDRFKSMQKRNIIEPRLRNRMKRKNKLTKFKRNSDKMDWEKTGYWNGEKIN